MIDNTHEKDEKKNEKKITDMKRW